MTRQEDVRKQHLAAQLFSGVTEKPRSSVGRGHLVTNRISRNPGKTKSIVTDPGMSSADDRSHSLQGTTSKSAGKSNMGLLLDLESNEPRDIEGEKTSFEKDALLSSLENTVNMVSLRDDEASDYIQESVDSDPLLVITTSEVNCSYQATQKVWHISVVIYHLILRGLL